MSANGSSGIAFRGLTWVVASALVGALGFVAAQHLAGFPMNIAQFMGGEIVRRGGYSPGLAGLAGWGVHLSVATSYAALYALIVFAPFFPRDERGIRWATALALAFTMGWLATLITNPAIAITIGVLSGQGVPDAVPSLNRSFGFVFWNHVMFFFASFAITVVGRDVLRARRSAAG